MDANFWGDTVPSSTAINSPKGLSTFGTLENGGSGTLSEFQDHTTK